MIRYLYSVKDDVAGSFDFYGNFVNDGTAVRSFRAACLGQDLPVTDLSLYRFAAFDTITGEITENDLTFLWRGEKNEI